MMNTCKAVLNGDVIASRKYDQALWQSHLKHVLSQFGQSPYDWDIYRGDGFQLFVDCPEDAFLVALRLRAGFKSVKGLDMRIAIGFGDISVRHDSVSESNGSAFVHAGELIDAMNRRSDNLALLSGDVVFDNTLNVSMAMASALIDRWLPNYAAAVAMALQYRDASQSELGEKLGLAQNTVSERLGRAYFRLLVDFESYFRLQVRTKYSGAK